MNTVFKLTYSAMVLTVVVPGSVLGQILTFICRLAYFQRLNMELTFFNLATLDFWWKIWRAVFSNQIQSTCSLECNLVLKLLWWNVEKCRLPPQEAKASLEHYAHLHEWSPQVHLKVVVLLIMCFNFCAWLHSSNNNSDEVILSETVIHLY